jgi:hemolysin activation/secretion protein
MFGPSSFRFGYSNVRGTRDSVHFVTNGVFTLTEIVWSTQPWVGNGGLVDRLALQLHF